MGINRFLEGLQKRQHWPERATEVQLGIQERYILIVARH